MKTTIFTIVGSILICGFSFAQSVTQSISGRVFDKSTKEPLIGATVVLLNTDPLVGTATDVDGKFTIPPIPVGRQSLQVSMIGYESYVANEIMVSTGREVVLEIGLQEDGVALKELVVKARKDVPLNTMASLSSRQFTVEETQRYAGGLEDPARLATSFAGVANPSTANNGISVRGNSPGGLQWRLEGVEIPNPSHFANLTIAGGGLLTALSSQVMGNSDFYTGAFPAEYGNASSGVFDIKLRNGNSRKWEHSFQAGLLGVDFASEGPFVNGKEATYLVNYRYSTMALIAPILPDNTGVLKYQDLSWKVNLPTKGGGTFSLWGIAALDGNEMEAADSTDWEANFDRDDSETYMHMFATGLSHKIRLNSNTFLHTTLMASGNGVSHEEERLDFDLQPHPHSKVDNTNWRYTLQSKVNHRFGKTHTNRTGFSVSYMGYDVDVAESMAEGESPQTISNARGETELLQFYTQSRIKLLPQLTLNAGVHIQYFMLNKDFSLEPRAALKYQFHPKHSLALAYGLHSRMESLAIYFVDKNGNRPNTNLDLMRSEHYVLAYHASLGEHMRLSIEPYYQRLTKVPIAPNCYLSPLNDVENIFFDEVLVNEGTGHNMGVDFTLERFLYKGFYYLFTASLFDSQYKDASGVERNTRFNRNYLFNALVGKEWHVGKQKNNLLGVNLRLNYMGGDRIEAIDLQSSLDRKDVVYGETNGQLSFAKKRSDLPIFSFTISFRKNKPRYSSVWSLQVLNATTAKEFDSDFYNLKTGTLDTKNKGIMIPNLSYRIEF